MPPNGVGGGGVHWNAEMWRFLPSDFVLKTHLTERYGASFLPEDMTIQDWGITYDELEPFYDRFEYLCGTSAPRAICAARSWKAAITSRARDPAHIRRRRSLSRSARPCSERRRASSATSPSRNPPVIFRRPTPTRSG